jgi:transcriptional regulator with XRE-family HTH domain
MASEPKPADVYVGARIRLRRQLIGQSQETLGQRIGVTFQQVQKYERGTNRVGASRLVLIAKALGVPPTYFFEGLDIGGDLASTRCDDVVTEFLASREGVQLAAAWVEIDDPDTRRPILELILSLARNSKRIVPDKRPRNDRRRDGQLN